MIKISLENLTPRSDERIFFGYSTNSITYRIYNKRTFYFGDAVNLVFDDNQNMLLEPVESQQEEKEPTINESKAENASDDVSCEAEVDKKDQGLWPRDILKLN